MHKSDVRRLSVSTFVIDPRVQRPLDRRRVGKIAAELNMDALGTLTISERDNGDYVVIDGQHRTEALKEAGQGAFRVSCRVFSGLTLQDEAAMFRLLNNTAKPQYLDQFRVRVIEGDPDAVRVNSIAKRHGWRIEQSGHSGCMASVQAFERVYLMDEVAAEKTLSTVTRAWGHDSSSADGRVLEGIGLVYVRYNDSVAVDELIDRLARFPGGAGGLIGRGRGLRDLVGSTLPRAIAEIVVEEYNKRRKTRALPPFRTA